MTPSTVEVATAALLRAWERDECYELWLQFRPRGRHGDLTEVVTAATEAANAAYEEEPGSSARTDSGQFAFGEGPWRVPVGRHAYLVRIAESDQPEALVGWLEVFAGHLEAAGLAGTLRPAPPADASSWSVVEAGRRIPQLAVFAAVSVQDLYPPPHRAVQLERQPRRHRGTGRLVRPGRLPGGRDLPVWRPPAAHLAGPGRCRPAPGPAP